MTNTPVTTLYEQDFYLWLEQTAELLKTGKFEKLDVRHLLEEIKGMSSSQRQALRSNLEVILMHLLKYKYQSEKRSNSWRFSILEHRFRLEDILEDSPSLGTYLLDVMDKCYTKARKKAVQETGMSMATFPLECPFTAEQVLDEDFLPE
ncbi:hypothetical protein GlitD10_0420 [Gloeomargarita lithophora Alchichica-D10]|uniref:DUF29 domain-containing protein n=1 Tax=Gloeomargarita lithophora Alchichica-D10 TaxID=1188229 RepID=A0A1J0A9X9_9CYAN|nr:DUF29 domain-containing protein [Gloeomargarita lithophora]APB32731.1 hypothetical protein GlitD10_0420 [Gloeomargarita lithophora Alchichica-D10]